MTEEEREAQNLLWVAAQRHERLENHEPVSLIPTRAAKVLSALITRLSTPPSGSIAEALQSLVRPDEDGHCERCGLEWEDDHECPPGFTSTTPPSVSAREIAERIVDDIDWETANSGDPFKADAEVDRTKDAIASALERREEALNEEAQHYAEELKLTIDDRNDQYMRRKAAEAKLAEKDREIERLKAELAEEERVSDQWLDRATYEVGAVPHFWEDRAKAAEARLDKAVKALKGIKRHGELSVVQLPDYSAGGKKPPSKEVWQFPRHMLAEIDAALAEIETKEAAE